MNTEFKKLKYDMLMGKQDLPEEYNPSESPYKVSSAIEWCLQRICSLSYFYPRISQVADIMLSTGLCPMLCQREVQVLHEKWFRSTLKNATETEDSKRLIERSVKAWTTAKNRRRLPRSVSKVRHKSSSK